MNAHTKPLPSWAITPGDPDQKAKEEFAELLLRRPREAFECAKMVTPDPDENFAICFIRSKAWPNDPYVKSYQKKLVAEHGYDFFLPSRYDMFHALWGRAQGFDGRPMEDRDYNTAWRNLSEMRGFVGNRVDTAGGGNVNNTIVLQFVKPDEEIKKEIKTIEVVPVIDALPPLNIEFKE